MRTWCWRVRPAIIMYLIGDVVSTWANLPVARQTLTLCAQVHYSSWSECIPSSVLIKKLILFKDVKFFKLRKLLPHFSCEEGQTIIFVLATSNSAVDGPISTGKIATCISYTCLSLSTKWRRSERFDGSISYTLAESMPDTWQTLRSIVSLEERRDRAHDGFRTQWMLTYLTTTLFPLHEVPMCQPFRSHSCKAGVDHYNRRPSLQLSQVVTAWTKRVTAVGRCC